MAGYALVKGTGRAAANEWRGLGAIAERDEHIAALEQQVADAAKNTEAVFDFGLHGPGWVQESRFSSLGIVQVSVANPRP